MCNENQQKFDKKIEMVSRYVGRYLYEEDKYLLTNYKRYEIKFYRNLTHRECVQFRKYIIQL